MAGILAVIAVTVLARKRGLSAKIQKTKLTLSKGRTYIIPNFWWIKTVFSFKLIITVIKFKCTLNTLWETLMRWRGKKKDKPFFFFWGRP